MNNEEAREEPLICGVPQSLLERFLRLIRDGYPKAELATCFLEERAGISNVPNMANVRDALSHFATFLDPTLDSDKRADQVVSAEEHFRRAIIEPYQIAVEDLTVKVAELYEKYKVSLLPVKDRHLSLQGAPNEVQVDARLRDIQTSVSCARTAKGRNRWDDQWERGVQEFMTAFDRLKELHSELEAYWYRFEQAKSDSEQATVNTRHTRLHIWGIVAAVVIGILGIIVSYLLYLLAKRS
jgi:hypothetical protein